MMDTHPASNPVKGQLRAECDGQMESHSEGEDLVFVTAVQYFDRWDTRQGRIGVPDPAEYAVGEVYKLELDGTILGKVVGDDVSRGTFQILHHIECRRANEIIGVGIAESLSQLITMSEK
jgi:hypothetical protein